MYDFIYKVWLKEKECYNLQELPEDFYDKLAEYISRIRQEGRMLDPQSPKAKLVSLELENTTRMTKEIVKLWYHG